MHDHMTQTCMQQIKYCAWCTRVLMFNTNVLCQLVLLLLRNSLFHPTQLEHMKVGDKQSHAYTSSAKLY